MSELEVLAELSRLATKSTAEYELCRKAEAEKLGFRLTVLDKEVAARRTRRTDSNTQTESDKTAGAQGQSNRSNEGSNSAPVRTPDELCASAKEIIESPDVLKEVDSAVAQIGFAGDRNPVLLTYVALTSRLLDKPINEHIIAPPAAGKNFALDTALALVPQEAVFKMTASTPKALIYSDQDLRHKTVILAECDSLLKLEGNAASLVRSIIEEARTDFETVEKAPETGQLVTRRVSKEGPTGLITTGVRGLESQISTRVLNVYLADTPEQTLAILKSEAEIASGQAAPVDPALLGRFHDFQRWLAMQPEPKVIVPFAELLATKVPNVEVRMRRDFKQLLATVKAIALLNQHRRARDSAGCIVADLLDYRWARLLLLPSFNGVVSGGATDAVRQTVDAVPNGEEVSEAYLVRILNLSKSTVHYRVVRAIRGGWLCNLETRKGHPYRLIRGVPLPADMSPLPTVEELESELAKFEHPAESNVSSNSPQTHGGVRQNGQPFECPNENEVEVDIDDDDSEHPAR